MAKSDGKRSERVGERIREELTTRLLRGDVHDPAVRDVVISAVTVTDDLGHARIYVRSIQTLSEAERDGLMRGLGRASGFLRREIGKSLAIRTVPELRFFWDESIDNALRMERLFVEIADERGRDDEGGKSR